MNPLQDKLHVYLSKNPNIGFIVYEVIRKIKRLKNRSELDNFHRLKKLGFNPQSIFDVGANRENGVKI